MKYKFFTQEEVEYIRKAATGNITESTDRFEDKFLKEHYEELIINNDWREKINTAIRGNLQRDELRKVKINVINESLIWLEPKTISQYHFVLNMFINFVNHYDSKVKERYIKLITYLLRTNINRRVNNQEELDLFVEEFVAILKDKDIKDVYMQIKAASERNKKEYYKLFIDLSSEEMDDIFNIFMNSTNATTRGEDISVKTRKIQNYCKEKNCDFLAALREVYLYIKGTYSCRWYNSETKDKGRDYFDEQKLEIHNKFYPHFIIYNDLPDINRKVVEAEEEFIYNIIINILEGRRANPEQYVRDVLQKVRLNFEYISHFDKEFYLDTLLIQEKSSNNETNEQETKNEAIEPENIDKYTIICEELSAFIKGGTPAIYKSVIEDKVLPKNTQPLRMKNDNKANIIRFADCFEIPLSKINNIFDIEVRNCNRNKTSKNDFLRALRKYNTTFYTTFYKNYPT